MPLVGKSNPPQPPNTPYWVSPDHGTYLYHADFLAWEEFVTEPFAHLVFADPPFNIGYKYAQYHDLRTRKEYLRWTEEWMTAARDITLPGGALFVCSGARYQAELKLALERTGWVWQDSIVWHYTFGPHQTSKLTPSWVMIHHATKDPDVFTWNVGHVKVPSARQTKYNDRRAQRGGKTPDNLWILDPARYPDLFQPEHNTVLASRVCGTFKERTGHPCQMPLAVVERCITLGSHPDDLVFDPFLGSGTTAHACRNLGRRCVGTELTQEYLDQYAIPRLQ